MKLIEKLDNKKIYGLKLAEIRLLLKKNKLIKVTGVKKAYPYLIGLLLTEGNYFLIVVNNQYDYMKFIRLWEKRYYEWYIYKDLYLYKSIEFRKI